METYDTSSTRTRRGGSCLKDIYETFLIYRTCMRRAPAKPVRACTLRNWCRVAHVTFEAPRLTSHLTVFTLHTAPFAINTSHFTLHSPQSTLHTPHFTLHSPHFTLLTSHCFLHTPHFTLHTALFTPHTSHCTLHTPHFISSELFSALLHVSKVERNSCWFFYMPKGVDHKIFTILRSVMPSVDALHQIATASVNMV